MKTSILCLALAVSGCATGYKPAGFGGGYSEIRLNEDTYTISVAGNGYTSQDRARNIALLRASDLTLQAGYDRFALLDGGVQSQVAGTTPITAQVIGNTVIESGGDAIIKPHAQYTVKMLRPASPMYASSLDARLIANQLRPQFASQ